jgi:hypothetical protein
VFAQPGGGKPIVLLRRMKVGAQVTPPRRAQRAHDAVAAEQEAPALEPGPRAPQAAVVPQVVERLAQRIGDEVPGHHAKQAKPPLFVAAHRAIQVERGAAVLGFLAGMPQP